MNCIFCCVFNQEKYIEMLYLLLESIFLYGQLQNNIEILIYTSTSFMQIIKKSHLYNDEKIKFEINDTYNDIDKACKARLDLFDLPTVANYSKILYLDIDVLIKNDIHPVFNICEKDILYVLEEGDIICNNGKDYWGKTLFGDEIHNYEDKTAFTSGILLFNNCETIKNLFETVKKDILCRPHNFHDQPYIVYNAFKYGLFDNKIIKKFAVNNDTNILSDKIIHHFPGGVGPHDFKMNKMTIFLDGLKNQYQSVIETILSNGMTLVSKERLQNLYNQCLKFKNTSYSFVECGVAKGGCLAMMKFASGKKNKIFGFDSFEGMPNTIDEDISNYNKSCPLNDFGKVGDNVSGEIENVYNTFEKLNLDMNNVSLVKGYFEDTLQIKESMDYIGKIAVLRLDGDWYASTKVCLEKLYDKVIEGGIIIIDDYGHFIGAKRATDEFIAKNNIKSPLIKTDYTEHYWIKDTNADKILSDTLNIEEDIWTCSAKMRYDIYDFFTPFRIKNAQSLTNFPLKNAQQVGVFNEKCCKNKSHFKIAEIGSHKGYSTKVLSKIFAKVYAVDNSVEWTEFNKNFNKDAKNIEYVMLDIYKDKWDVLPEDIEVAFIDADHSYEGCKSDIFNCIKRFNNLQYIIFDDYGVWNGVKQIIDQLIEHNILHFERFIGITDVPGPNGIVKNVNEGIICSLKRNNTLQNKVFRLNDFYIKFLDGFKLITSLSSEGFYFAKDNDNNIVVMIDGKIYGIKIG